MRATGQNFGAHLHLEVIENVKKKDPCDYLQDGCPALGSYFPKKQRKHHL